MNNIFFNSLLYFNNIIKEAPTPSTIDKNNFNVIGIFDTQYNIWYNGWSIYYDDNKNYKSEYNIERYYRKIKELLQYSIDLTIDYQISDIGQLVLLRSILINSKFYMPQKGIQLRLILGIITYLLKATRIYKVHSNNSFEVYVVETPDGTPL